MGQVNAGKTPLSVLAEIAEKTGRRAPSRPIFPARVQAQL